MRLVAAVIALSALLVTLAATGGAQTQGTTQLTGTVGPGFTITLKTRTKAVKTLAPSKYTFVINDRSNIHNFHLTGPGVNKKTKPPLRSPGRHVGQSRCARARIPTFAILTRPR